MLNVLIVAEACNPTWTSVPLVGHNMADALARREDLKVTVVTHPRNAEGLAGSELAANAEVVYVDSDRVGGPLYALGKRLRGGDSLGWSTNAALSWPGYVYFEGEVARRLGPRLAAGEFDLVHRVTPVSPAMAGPLAERSPVPMLLGPINGGLSWPKEHRARRRSEGEWLAPFRKLHRWLPYRRSTYRHARGAIVASKSAEGELPRWFRGKVWRSPENGVDPRRFPIALDWPAPSPGRPFAFVCVGRMVPCKAMDLIVEAMAGSSLLRGATLDLIGDGPERPALEALVERRGLAGQVRFRGWLGQSGVAEALGSSQAFVFPSVHEFGGGAVLEAMARGLPCVVADYGGPAELVDDSCGARVPIADDATMARSLRDEMEGLMANPGRCQELGRAAARKVREEHAWDAKAERLVSIYHEALGRERP